MTVTVFTPIYNRAYIIKNLYESLQRQTTFDFEWLIVDDGSTDDSEKIISGWVSSEYRFPIRYYKKKNGGKCRAINSALELAAGELFFTVDSDDYITDDAIQKIIQWEHEIHDKKSYCGFAGNIGTSLECTSNSLFDNGYYDGNFLDRYKNVDGERAVVIYTSVHRQYRYPEFEGEKFMTEAVVWNRMAADGYKMRFYNDIIWIFEYQEDGLTKAGNKLFLQNPQGYGLWLCEKNRFIGATKLEMLKVYYTFSCDLDGLYSCSKIADYIGTNVIIIILCKFIHRIKCLRTIHIAKKNKE